MWNTEILENILIKKESGKRPKGGVSKYDSGTPSIGAEHLTNTGDFDFSNIKYVPQDYANKMNRGHIEIGDLLVVKDGATTGKISLVKENFPFQSAVINEHVILCRVRDDINNKFVFYKLWSESGQKEILKDFRGAAQGGISQGFAEKVEIPVPPLPIQNRIVGKIEELFSELDHGVENLKKAQKQLKTYRQAVLKDAFEGKLTKEWREQQTDLPTPEELLQQIKAERKAHHQRELAEWEKEVEQWEKDGKPGKKPRKPRKLDQYNQLTGNQADKLNEIPKRWAWMKVGNICPSIVPNRDKPKTFSGDIPWLTTPNIDTKKISIDLSKIEKGLTPHEVEKYNARLIPPESVIMTCVGTFGVICVNKISCVCNQQLHAFITKHLVIPEYLAYALKEKKAWMEKEATSTTVSYLNKTKANSVPIPICSKKEQVQVVQEIESRLSVVDQLEQTIKENLQKAEALRQSILKKAFGGELIKEMSVRKSQELEVSPFEQMQMLGVLIEILKEEYDMAYGEMALAKFLFLVDRTKKYKTGFTFKDWHWGPYDPEIKKRLFSKSSFFKKNQKKHSVIELKDNQDQLFKYNLRERDLLESGVRDIAEIISQFKGRKNTSRQLELLATVAKAIENESSTDLEVVREGMKKWKTPKTEFKNKAEKFSEEETEKCLSFIQKQGWDLMLIDK